MTPQEYQKQQRERLLKSYSNGIEKAVEFNDFNNIVSQLFNIQNILEHCHRQTKSEPKHEALGEAYTTFADLKDQIIEHIIGATGTNYKTINLSNVPDYTPELNNVVAQSICVLGDKINQFAKQNNIPSVENLSQDVCGVGAQLKYKLSLNDSDESKVIDVKLKNKDSFVQKSLDIINKSLELFEKGGEGSRGGKIIGHTKSGKPIYSNGYHTDYSSKNYSSEDHEDISNHHSNVSKKSEAHYGKETTHSKEHKEWAEAHKQFSKEKSNKQ